ncbi:hypothetical protein DL93DRAFT_1700746 [Clavulina sp. PMI_390]|nr:hypothetical protein DL93DRAFT_1700746 [Clavulina sp. PMI_390]
MSTTRKRNTKPSLKFNSAKPIDNLVTKYPEEGNARLSALKGLKKVWSVAKLPLYGTSLASADLEDLWMSFHFALRGDGPPRLEPTSDPLLVSALIKGGIVKVLAQLIIENALSIKAMNFNDFMSSMWWQALEALGSLGKDIPEHDGAMFRRAEIEWNNHGLELVKAYMSCPHIVEGNSDVGVDRLVLVRLMCLWSLCPVFKPKDTLAVPNPALP